MERSSATSSVCDQRVNGAAPKVGKETLSSGVRWIATTQIAVQLGRLALAVILARLLVPADFGVVSLGMIVVAFVDIALGDVGTAAVIVQRQDLTDYEISSLFWFNICVGAASTGVALVASPLMSHVIDHPDVVLAFRVVAFSFVIASVRMAHLAVLRRELRYRDLAVLDVAAFLLNFVVGVGLAVAGAGLWSLIVGTITGNIAMTLGSWMFSGFRPSVTFRWAHLRSVATFSLNLSAFRFVNFFVQQGDRFLVGAYLGADALGFYSQANRLVRYPLDTATIVYRRVLVPAMSRDQDDLARLRAAFLRSTGVIAVIVVPFTLLAAVLAEPLILALPGEQWLPAVPLIRLLAVVGLLQTVSGQAGVLLQIRGRTDLLLYWGFGSGIVAMTAYAVGLQWGVEGVAWGYLVAMAVLTVPSFYFPMRVIDTKLRRLWPELRGVTFAGGLLVAVSSGLLRLVDGSGTNSWIQLVVCSSGGCAAYLGVLVASKNRALIDLVAIGSPGMAQKLDR